MRKSRGLFHPHAKQTGLTVTESMRLPYHTCNGHHTLRGCAFWRLTKRHKFRFGISNEFSPLRFLKRTRTKSITGWEDFEVKGIAFNETPLSGQSEYRELISEMREL